MKISLQHIESRIVDTQYRVIQDTLTLCFVTLDNGFIVTGESRPIDAADFDAARGETLARQDALDKLWPYFGFMALECQFKSAVALAD